MSAEEWRSIPGASRYEASSLGRVRSLIVNRVLSQSRNPQTGYMQVGICRDACPGQYTRPVHYWIALAFLGFRSEGQVVRHLDGNKLNNNIENLTYGTPAENVADTYAHGYKAPRPFAKRGTCRAGHEISSTNTRTDSRGYPECRACDRELTRARRANRVPEGQPVPWEVRVWARANGHSCKSVGILPKSLIVAYMAASRDVAA